MWIPTLDYFDALREKYGFQLEDSVVIPLDGASFLDRPTRKVGIFFKAFNIVYRLTTYYFLDELLCKHGVNIYELNPNVMTKIAAFEMLCCSQGFLLDIWVFKNYFCLSSSNEK
ncbi:unnamed protein product [Lactuca virosa]|uniref:Uncharacterized protein n=1 Tax=Lactuca virosa TaxID=75947 RepID=A0AAU9PNN6_9ASTR|nr:unnamed protein product [Lactuca virosa]